MQTVKTDQTGCMPRLISLRWGSHAILLVLSCAGWYIKDVFLLKMTQIIVAQKLIKLILMYFKTLFKLWII